MILPSIRNWSTNPRFSALLATAEVRLGDPAWNLPAGEYSFVVAERWDWVWEVQCLARLTD